LCASIASRLVIDALERQPGSPLAGWVEGWSIALQWCITAFGQELYAGGVDFPSEADDGGTDVAPPLLCLPIRWNSLATITAIIRAVISPKLTVFGVSEVDTEHLVRLVAEGFIGAVGPDPTSQPCVQLTCVAGLPVAASQCSQSLLLDTPLAAEDGFLLPMTVATVAVFTCPLDLPSQFHSLETADGLPSHRRIERHHAHGEEDWSPEGEHLASLRSLLLELARLKVRVVASQRVIHPAVRAMCRHLRILPLERLSARHIGAFLRVTGARALGSPCLLEERVLAAHLGRVGALRLRRSTTTERPMVEVLPPHDAPGPPPELSVSAAPVCTILVGAPSDLLMEEVRAAVAAALRVLGQFLRVPLATPGGGCTELLLAHHLSLLLAHHMRRGPRSPSVMSA